VIANGRKPSVVARVAGVSRQAVHRVPARRPVVAGPGRPDPGDTAIVEVAGANPADGTQMVAAIASRELGQAVNRKRVQRIMRQHRLLQPVNGTQFTSRDFRKHLSARGVTHCRGSYRDPESQAFIESWFGQFKKRCAWRNEWETIDQARHDITTYIYTYHHRPHSGLGYLTPAEVAQTWRTINKPAT
jgi:transposase InsO family protein